MIMYRFGLAYVKGVVAVNSGVWGRHAYMRFDATMHHLKRENCTLANPFPISEHLNDAMKMIQCLISRSAAQKSKQNGQQTHLFILPNAPSQSPNKIRKDGGSYVACQQCQWLHAYLPPRKT
jgi:hypothetical protein